MEEIVRRAKEGDNQAFEELVISLEQDLYKIARTRLSNSDDVNEAVQETIIKAYSSLKKLREEKYFKTWIIKILINQCNYIHKKGRQNESLEYEEIRIEENNNDSLKEKINDLDFFILIKDLNYDERIAITLFYLEGFSTKEISKILKKPEGTIKTRISRARKKLKDLLEKGGIKYEESR